MSEETKNGNGEATVDTRPGITPGIYTTRAIDFLKAGKPGDVVTREKMTNIIGRDCGLNSLGYGNVNSAIRICERDHKIVWRWDRNEKVWVCLDGSQAVDAGYSHRQRARKEVKRSLVVANSIDAGKLSDDKRRDLGVLKAAAGVMLLAGGTSFAKRLQAIGTNQPTEPDAARLIELMKPKA